MRYEFLKFSSFQTGERDFGIVYRQSKAGAEKTSQIDGSCHALMYLAEQIDSPFCVLTYRASVSALFLNQGNAAPVDKALSLL
jgi:hypothetical protein